MTDPKCDSFNTLPNQEELDPGSWHTEGNQEKPLPFLSIVTFMRAGTRGVLSLFSPLQGTADTQQIFFE